MFLVNVPIGIVALFVVAKVLNMPHTRREHRIDWWGALTLVVGVVPLLLVAEQGREWGWGSAAVGRLLRDRRASASSPGSSSSAGCGDDALIPMRLFRNRRLQP